MDALTFGTKILLRNLNSKKEPITEISYDTMLAGFEMDHTQFVDLCILCGCDYTDTIDGVILNILLFHNKSFLYIYIYL